jgi:type I restriction enzyme, S subunit
MTAALKRIAYAWAGYAFDSERFSTSEGTPLVRIRDLTLGEASIRYTGDVPTTAWIENGDTLVGMDGEFVAVRWTGGRAALNQRVCCLKSTSAVDPGFLFYAIQDPLRRLTDLAFETTVKHLSVEELLAEKVPLPALTEQQAIAGYLDQETARIGRLISAKRALIDLLIERRMAHTAWVTRHGLSVAGERSTGLPWMASIPKHWAVAPLKRLGPIRSGVTFPPEYQGRLGEELGYLKVSDFNSPGNLNRIRSTDNTVSRKTAQELGATIFPPGTVMFPKIGAALLLNKRRVLEIHSCADQNLMGFTVREGNWTYYAGLLEGVDVSRLMMPGPIPFINEDDVGEIRVAAPPIQEQQAIAEHISQQTARTDSAVDALRLSISKLAERRDALVARAIEGELN